MKYRYYLLIGILLFAFISQSFFKKSYDRKELLVRYITNNNVKFNNSSKINLLVIRSFMLSCCAQQYGYSKDSAINYSIKKLGKEERIFVLNDNDSTTKYLSIRYSNFKNLTFINDKAIIMDKYGFYFKPFLFQIENNKLVKYFNLEKYCKQPISTSCPINNNIQ